MQLTATTHRPLQTCWQTKDTGAVTQRRGTNFASSRRTGCTCPALFSSSCPCPALFSSRLPPPVQCCPGQRRPTLTPPSPTYLLKQTSGVQPGLHVSSRIRPARSRCTSPTPRAIHFIWTKFSSKIQWPSIFDPERLEERREVTFEKRHFEEVAAVILHISCHLTFLQPHFSSH